MFDQKFNSLAEIDQIFADHLDSLRNSGMEFDEIGLMAQWVEAVENYKEGKTNPPWLTKE